ncbi:hypothetical protein ACQ4LE_003851 [Meloidogyne hapla]
MNLKEESFNKIQNIQDAALALYNQYNDKKYGKIHQKLENAQTIESEKLFEINYVTGIFNKLWAYFETKSKADENTITEAFSLWKSFALNFELPSNSECTCGKNMESKKYQKGTNIKQILTRRKRSDEENPGTARSGDVTGQPVGENAQPGVGAAQSVGENAQSGGSTRTVHVTVIYW